MALVLQDRVKENSTTSGTGTITLAGAYTGFRTFASCIPSGSTTYYCIHNLAPGYQTEWEVGLGTFTSPDQLARTTVLSSSNSGSLVNFTAGSGGLEVFVTYPSEKAVYEEANGETLIDGGPITVVGSNVTSLPALPAELGKFVGNIDLFAQIYNLNQSSGQNASADFVAYNSDTDVNGTTFFVDMGINSPNYSSVDYPIFTPNSGYLFSLGDGGSNTSTLFVGSGDGDVRVFAGGLDTNNTVATFGTDLSTDLAGALDVGSTLNVTGVTTLSALAYTSGNIAAAANNTVLVTKQYVDDATSNGFHVHTPVLVATTGNLTASYNNGASGVGATLTNSGAQAALSIDGVSMNVNDRVLVWQQTTGTQNGVYVVTTVGSGSTNWVLTRSSDADTAGESNPDELGGGDYFFVQSGSTLGYHSYICTNTGTITFGTTAITFSEFSSIPAYTGGTNINVDGQVISITGTVGPTNGGTGVNTVTTGDLLYGSASNTWSKLALGAANKSLVVNGSGTQVEWNAVSLSASGAVSGVLPEANGGTNNSSYVTGDTLYASGTNTLAKLSPNTTTTKKFLGQIGTGSAGLAPFWGQPAASDITGLAPSATTDTTNASNISSGTLANARTTASSSNGASTIVARDASGNFSANTITANVIGNISGSAASLTNAQNFQISGGATAANVSFNGTGAVNLSVTAMNASVINTGTIGNAYTTASSSNGASTIVARDASGNFTANVITASSISASGSSLTSLNASAINSGTIANAYTTASSSNGSSTIVARDGSGNFSAGTITATLNGNASTATSASQIDGWDFANTGSNSGTDADTLNSNGITYYTAGVPNFTGNSTDGALYSQAYSSSWQHQIAADYRSGQIALRGKNNGTWQSWRTVLDSSNYTSYAPSLTGSGASGTWGISISGSAANASALQGYTWNGAGKDVRGTEIYADNWFRNYNSNEGLYNEATTQHWSSSANGYWDSSSTTTYSGIRLYTGGHVTSLRGYVYADSSNQIGFLNNSGSWSWKMDSSGNGTATGNVTAYSDERLKKDWADLPEDFIERLAAVKHGTYTRIDSGERQAGASAQDMQKVLSETVMVGTDEEKTLSLAYGNAALVAAIELAKQVVELKKEIELLKAK